MLDSLFFNIYWLILHIGTRNDTRQDVGDRSESILQPLVPSALGTPSLQLRQRVPSMGSVPWHTGVQPGGLEGNLPLPWLLGNDSPWQWLSSRICREPQTVYRAFGLPGGGPGTLRPLNTTRGWVLCELNYSLLKTTWLSLLSISWTDQWGRQKEGSHQKRRQENAGDAGSGKMSRQV